MPRAKQPRFRIELLNRKCGWEAKVYDLEDHGPDQYYAAVTGGSLERVLDDAAHYVLVADDPTGTAWLDDPGPRRRQYEAIGFADPAALPRSRARTENQ